MFPSLYQNSASAKASSRSRQAEAPSLRFLLVRDFTTERPGPPLEGRVPLIASGVEHKSHVPVSCNAWQCAGFPKSGSTY
jgi:hypothetical protein